MSVSAGLPPSALSKRLVISPEVRTCVSWESDNGVIRMAFHFSRSYRADADTCSTDQHGHESKGFSKKTKRIARSWRTGAIPHHRLGTDHTIKPAHSKKGYIAEDLSEATGTRICFSR